MEAVKVFDKANLAAFEKHIRARFDAAAKKTSKKGGKPRERPDHIRRRWGEALQTIHAARKNVAAYIALAEETGLTAKDCHTIAALFVSKRKPEEALSWVERGLEIDRQTRHGSMASCDLTTLNRDLLARLGRGDEALDAAWNDYRKHPNIFTYDDLMKYVPKARKMEWHRKAIEAAMGSDLQSVMDLLCKTKEMERLAELIHQTKDDDLEELSHFTTEPVAEKLEKPHPDLAARLWKSQGLRIAKARKSKYYGAALAYLERAKHCFKRAGLEDEWNMTVQQVRADHHRKSSFMPGFERLVEGMGSSDEPSFLDRARTRWKARGRRA